MSLIQPADGGYCIWIVSPPGCSHSRCFEEVAQGLSESFAELGDLDCSFKLWKPGGDLLAGGAGGDLGPRAIAVSCATSLLLPKPIGGP